MKWIVSCLLAGVFLFQQSSCKDDPPKPLTELEKLPPETRIGKQTFGCLINGKAFAPVSKVDIYSVFQQGILTIGAESDRPDQWIGITLIENGNVLEPGSYNLTDPPYQKAKAYYSECYYYEEHTIDGSVTITRFDKFLYIISGTFAFSTFTSAYDTLKITDGRFDIKYVP